VRRGYGILTRTGKSVSVIDGITILMEVVINSSLDPKNFEKV